MYSSAHLTGAHADEPACLTSSTMRSHFSCHAVADAVRGSKAPSTRPVPIDRISRVMPGHDGELLGLARGGVYHAPTVTSRAVRSCRTLSPLPVRVSIACDRSTPSAVCFLWHFPSPLDPCQGGWALPTTVSCRARTFLSRSYLLPQLRAAHTHPSYASHAPQDR